jgi:hypothetical protein
MSLLDNLRRAVEGLREEAEHAWTGTTDSRAMAQLFRPNLGPTPQPLRRVLEPLLAGSALAVLAGLAGVSLAAFLVMFIAAGLIYLIITYVFGVELGLELPERPW